jgi:mannose/fructose-specific phosphotransferase system component IIA
MTTNVCKTFWKSHNNIELKTGQNLQIVIKVKKSKFNMMASFV